jgi:hypothetical protein
MEMIKQADSKFKFEFKESLEEFDNTVERVNKKFTKLDIKKLNNI